MLRSSRISRWLIALRASGRLLEYYSGGEGIGLTLIDSHEAWRKPGSVAPFTYYKAPEKTAARTLPHGWQTFGDIGHVDADGHLCLTDRADDVVISGGVNIYPQEIEADLPRSPTGKLLRGKLRDEFVAASRAATG